MLYAHRKLLACWPLSSPMNSVRSFSENFRLSGLPIVSGSAVLPSASAAMSLPAISALVCTGTHSLRMAAPLVSVWPPVRLCCITTPAFSAAGKLMLLAAFQPLALFSTIES
ncbi:hypothetical protein D3C86_1665880 [compost metagenome]